MPHRNSNPQKLTPTSGKVSDIQVTPAGDSKTATVTFEKETAMKTALLLNRTQLGASTINVSSLSPVSEREGTQSPAHPDTPVDELTQEMKPRARILAEYLASGYVIGDATLQRAIELDTQHHVSGRFLSTIQNLDSRYHASDRAKATDESYGITAKGKNLLSGLGSYFEKATNTPTGKSIVSFYTNGSRQVQDIHAEARRLAELRKEAHGGSARRASGLERVFGKEGEEGGEKQGGEKQGAGGQTSGVQAAGGQAASRTGSFAEAAASGPAPASATAPAPLTEKYA